MKFGVIYELSVPRPFATGIERQVILNALEQIRLANELGRRNLNREPLKAKCATSTL